MDLLFSNDRRGEYPPSLYADQVKPLSPFAQLAGEARADVCVIGGGYTGLSAALHLAQSGFDVTLLEAHRVGFGASGRNGGQLGSGQRLGITELETMAGRETAQKLWGMAEEAKRLTRTLAELAGVGVYNGVAHAFRKSSELDQARREAEHLLTHYDYEQIEIFDQTDFYEILPSPAYCGGELDHGGGHLNPLALALGYARLAVSAGARLHELSHVTRIEFGYNANAKSIVRTAAGQVTCDHVILAVNGYLDDLVPEIATRVMPINNFIAATAPLGDRARQVLTRNIAAHDTKFVVNYWRIDDEGRLVFGGGENVSYRFPGDIAAKVRKPLAQIYPSLAGIPFTHVWGGTLAITMNRMPCFMRPAPNALSASGFSGHGVALATLAGKQMADAIAGQAAGFDTMTSLPFQRFPGGPFLRWPLLVAGMSWYALRDRLGL